MNKSRILGVIACGALAATLAASARAAALTADEIVNSFEATFDNASIAWPQGRKHFKAGTLTLTQDVHERAEQCARRNFDPLVVTDGIATTDDPVLLFRSPTYGLAFAKILAQALASDDAPAADAAAVVGR